MAHITIAPNPGRVRVTFAGRVIADTTRALTLREGSYPPVQYVPREDVDMTRLKRTQHQSYCPHKGHAAYYSIEVDGRLAENAVWTYEQPVEAALPVGSYLAFYRNRVDALEEIS